MKIWIHINGIQEGPFEDNQLPLDRMDATTPVWYAGLEGWMEAGKAPVTAAILARCSAQDDVSAEQPEVTVTEVEILEENPKGGSVHVAGREMPQQPNNYLVWSMLLTVLCCNPVGIVPIITGLSTASKYRNFDYDGAERSSRTTEWWLAITIVTSLIILVFMPVLFL